MREVPDTICMACAHALVMEIEAEGKLLSRIHCLRMHSLTWTETRHSSLRTCTGYEMGVPSASSSNTPPPPEM